MDILDPIPTTELLIPRIAICTLILIVEVLRNENNNNFSNVFLYLRWTDDKHGSGVTTTICFICLIQKKDHDV
jgi:hypothetical protein